MSPTVIANLTFSAISCKRSWVLQIYDVAFIATHQVSFFAIQNLITHDNISSQECKGVIYYTKLCFINWHGFHPNFNPL